MNIRRHFAQGQWTRDQHAAYWQREVEHRRRESARRRERDVVTELDGDRISFWRVVSHDTRSFLGSAPAAIVPIGQIDQFVRDHITG